MKAADSRIAHLPKDSKDRRTDRVNARDLIQLKESLKQVPAIKQLVGSLDHPKAKARAEKIDPCGDLLWIKSRALTLP